MEAFGKLEPIPWDSNDKVIFTMLDEIILADKESLLNSTNMVVIQSGNFVVCAGGLPCALEKLRVRNVWCAQKTYMQCIQFATCTTPRIFREQKFLLRAFHKVSSLGGNGVRCTAPIKNLELLSANSFERLLHFFVLSQLTMMNVKPRTFSSIYWYLDGGTLVCKYICTSFSTNESSNVLDKSLNLYHNYLVK